MGDLFVSARWRVRDGRALDAKITTHAEVGASLVQTESDQLPSKIDWSIPALRRALRRARLATGGVR